MEASLRLDQPTVSPFLRPSEGMSQSGLQKQPQGRGCCVPNAPDLYHAAYGPLLKWSSLEMVKCKEQLAEDYLKLRVSCQPGR